MKYFNRNPQKMKTIFLKITFLLYIGLLINCTSNNDPQDQLPPITQIGANTFGAIVDGRVFIPKDKTGYYAPGGGRPRGINIFSGVFSNSSDYFVIETSNYQDIYIYIYIQKDIPKEILYDFQDSPGVEYSLDEPNYAHIYTVINGDKYLSYTNSGSITFTRVNYDEGIYSGTFSVQLKNKDNPTDIIEITDGRFDIDLGTLNQG